MTSDRQIQANRENSKKSTGPKTGRGLYFSKRNALKHGLFSKEIFRVLEESPEDNEGFLRLLTGLKDQFQPVGELEKVLVNSIGTNL